MKRIVGMGGQEIKATLGKNIKLLRALRQYSQADLAEKAEISITFLSNIERGLKYPKPEVLSRIADALSVEAYELFKTNIETNDVPIVMPNDNKKMLYRLSKVMTRRVNNAMEGVFKTFMK